MGRIPLSTVNCISGQLFEHASMYSPKTTALRLTERIYETPQPICMILDILQHCVLLLASVVSY